VKFDATAKGSGFWGISGGFKGELLQRTIKISWLQGTTNRLIGRIVRRKK
jgi:hypothetical protein